MKSTSTVGALSTVIIVGMSCGACTDIGGRTGIPARTGLADAAEEVRLTETAFAKTMADRDFRAFAGYLSNEAIFFSDHSVAHGAVAITAVWKPYFEGSTPPFAWEPDHVEVLASGGLALSTGPVYAGGKLVGRFNSIWRLDKPHTWHIVFDKGAPVCAPGTPS